MALRLLYWTAIGIASGYLLPLIRSQTYENSAGSIDIGLEFLSGPLLCPVLSVNITAVRSFSPAALVREAQMAWDIRSVVDGRTIIVCMRGKSGVLGTNELIISLKIIGAYVFLPSETTINVERLQDARGSFSRDMSRVEVEVPEWARDRLAGLGRTVQCEEIVVEKDQLGAKSRCSWTSGTQFTLFLGDFPTLLPGLSLSLVLPGLQLPLCLTSPPFPVPTPIITASHDPSDPESLSLDCYASYGTSKRSFACIWALSNRDKPIQAPAITVRHLAAFDVNLTVTNIWGNSAFAIRTFGGNLTVEFPFGAEIHLNSARTLLLRPEILSSNVLSPIFYWWSSNIRLNRLCEQAQLFCNVPAGLLEPGEWALEVKVKEEKRWGIAQTVLKVRNSIGSLMVQGADCMVEAGLESYTIDGSQTINPDTGSPVLLFWSLFPSNCTLFPAGHSLTFAPFSCLTAGANHTLTVAEGSSGLRREYWLMAVDWGKGRVVARPVGRVAGRGNLQLSAIVSGVVTETCSWSQLTQHNSLSYPSFSQLLLPISSLDPGQLYTFQYYCAGTFAHVSFTVNSPPSGGIFHISPPSGEPGFTIFSLIAQSWIDEDSDYPLTYQYTDVNGRKWSFPSLLPIAKTYLAPNPAGNTTLAVYLSTCDSLFSCSISFAEVQIPPFLPDFNISLVQKPNNLLQSFQYLALLTAIQRDEYRTETTEQVAQGLMTALSVIMLSFDEGNVEKRDQEGFVGAICSVISQVAHPKLTPFRVLSYLTTALSQLDLSAAVLDCLPALSSLQVAAEYRLDVDLWEMIADEPALGELKTLGITLATQANQTLIPYGPALNLTYPGVSLYAFSGSAATLSSLNEIKLPIRNGGSAYTIDLPSDWMASLPLDSHVQLTLYTTVVPPVPFAPLIVSIGISELNIEITDLSISIGTEYGGIRYHQYKEGLHTVYPQVYITANKWDWESGRMGIKPETYVPTSNSGFNHTIPVQKESPLYSWRFCYLRENDHNATAVGLPRTDLDLAYVHCTCKGFGAAALQEYTDSTANFSPIGRAQIILQHTFNGSVFLILVVYFFLAIIAVLLVLLDWYDKPQLGKVREKFARLQVEVVRCLVNWDQIVPNCCSNTRLCSLQAVFSRSPGALPSVISRLSPSLSTLPSLSHASHLLPNIQSSLHNPSYRASLRYLYFQYQLGIRQPQACVAAAESAGEVVTDDLVGRRSLWAMFVWENELLGLIFMRMCSVTRLNRFPILAISVLGPLYAYSTLLFQARRDPNDWGHAIAATKGQFWGGTDTASTVTRAILFVLLTSGVQKAILWFKPEKWHVTEAKTRVPRREKRVERVLKWVQIVVARVLPWTLCLYLFLLCVIIMWNFTLQEMQMVLENNIISTAFEFFVCFHCLSGLILLLKHIWARLRRCMRRQAGRVGHVGKGKPGSISATVTESFSAKRLVL